MPSFKVETKTASNTSRSDLQIKTVRTTYTILQADVEAGFAGMIPVAFDVPFADDLYTISQAIHDTTAGGANGNDYSPGDFHDKTASGFNTAIYVGPGAVAGEVVEIHSVAIHD